jgi:hypothetical protein
MRISFFFTLSLSKGESQAPVQIALDGPHKVGHDILLLHDDW